MGLPVDLMLKLMDSEEVSRWMAYEQQAGPLGHGYSNMMLAGIHEQLQKNSYLLGALLVAWGGADENPAQRPEPVPRPHEWFNKAPEPEEADESNNLEQFMSEVRRLNNM